MPRLRATASRPGPRVLRTVGLILLAALPGCSTVAQDEDAGDGVATGSVARVAAGTVPNTDIFVATVYDDDNVIAYFCGGPETFQTHTRWFSGPPDAHGSFEHVRDGWRVVGEADDAGVRGILTEPDGTEHPFTTHARKQDDALTGLYAADIDTCTAGVVVADIGGAPTAQGTYFCEGDQAASVQVIILAPVTLAPDGGIDVVVELPTGPNAITVQPI